MPASLALDTYIAAVERAGEGLLQDASAAGFDAAVPTCSGWTVAHLVAHQAMVHQWATAQVTGTDPAAVPTQTALRALGDLPERYGVGLRALVAALRAAPADLRAMTFLNDAPSPLEFWARRQAHETTIHGLDALAARLGRPPVATELDIHPAFAADGVDELLRGFFTRGRSKLFDSTRFTIRIALTDQPIAFRLHVDDHLVVDDGAAPADDAVTIAGTAAGVYSALWNRSTAIEVSGDGDIVQRWRTTQRIRWS